MAFHSDHGDLVKSLCTRAPHDHMPKEKTN